MIQEIEANLTPRTAGVNNPVVNSPANIWRRYGDAGYVEWIASDADVADGELAGYYTVNGSAGTDSPLLPWYSGEKLYFSIETIQVDNSWTIYVYDLDDNMVSDTIGTTWWTHEDYPIIESISIVQDGVERDIKEYPYIETGKGEFLFKVNWEDAAIYQPTLFPLLTPWLHHPNKIRSVETELRGFYPNFDFNFFIPALGNVLELNCDDITPDFYFWIIIPIDNLLSNRPLLDSLWYGGLPSFTQSGDSYTLDIRESDRYMWRTWALLPNNPIFQQLFYKRVQDVEYRVTNKFTLDIETGNILTGTDYFIYDQQRYNNLLEIDLENKDFSAPTCSIQNATQVDEESNVKIEAAIADEFKGSGVDVDGVTLYYSVNGGATWGTNRMLYVEEDGVFKGNIPPPGAGVSIVYYIEMNDMEGNSVNTENFYFSTPIKPVPPIVITVIGIVAVAVAAVSLTIIYRKRNQPAIITLPSKKKVDKYYKKVNKEEG